MRTKVLNTFKDDFAPVIFFFDLFSTQTFDPPVIPLPLRIDRIYNGDFTGIILPDFTILSELLKIEKLCLNYSKFIKIGIKNLIKYAKEKYNEFERNLGTPLDDSTIISWFKKSVNVIIVNPSLKKDLTFLIKEFITLISKYFCQETGKMKVKILKNLMIKHCEVIIDRFKQKIEDNEIMVIKNRKREVFELYMEKRGKFYPNMIPQDVVILKNYKVRQMKFVPYLIYDDILDSYIYNKNLLVEGKKQPYNLDLWKINQIINKRSNIENNNIEKYILENFTLNNINIGNLINNEN